jgi:hypothetical protein
MKISFTPKTFFYLFGSIICLLILAHLGGMLATYYFQHTNSYYTIEYFNLASENNFPTFFASFQLLLAAVVLALIAIIRRKQQQKDFWYWAVLAAIFVFLSLDESIMIHELVSVKMRQHMDVTGDHFFAWVIPYSLLVLLVGVAYLRFVFRLPPFVRDRVLLAGFVFVAGALGLEIVESYYYSQSGVKDLNFAILTTLEESMEMFGILLFIYALLHYIAYDLKGLQINLLPQKRAETKAPESQPIAQPFSHGSKVKDRMPVSPNR